jgi:hypothetical protein
MKIFSIIGFLVVVALFLIAPAAAVTVVNSDFSGDGTGQWVYDTYYRGQTGWVAPGYPPGSGQQLRWFRSVDGSNAWAELNTNRNDPNGKYNNSGYLGQVINYPGMPGDITLSFLTKYQNIDTLGYVHDTDVKIFGKTAEPAREQPWGTDYAFGTLLGSYDFSPGDDQTVWDLRSYTISGKPAYNWYTIVFMGNIEGSQDKYVMIDNVTLNVPSAVPIPPSIWLLGSGIIGLVGLRRRFWR